MWPFFASFWPDLMGSAMAPPPLPTPLLSLVLTCTLFIAASTIILTLNAKQNITCQGGKTSLGK